MIVVVDRRVLIRDCFVRNFATTGDGIVVVGFASILDWQRAAARYPRPAVIVLVCGQPGDRADMTIMRDLPPLARSYVDIPVIVICDFDDPDVAIAALKGGARGFIPTSVSLDVTIEAIRLVRAGGFFVPAQNLISAWREDKPLPASSDGAGGALTPRQTAILKKIRRGKANKQIAYELNMCESTVKVHVRNIMKKLKATNRTQVALWAAEQSPHGSETAEIVC